MKNHLEVLKDEMEDVLEDLNERKKKSLFEKFKDNQRTTAGINPLNGIIATIPAIFLIVLFSLVPAILNVLMSFTNYSGNIETMEIVWLDNYVNVFGSLKKDVFQAFGHTFEYAALVILPLQVISLGAALLVNMKIKGRGIFRALFFMPTILGTAVICSVWGMIFEPIDSLGATILGWFGKSSAFLGDEKISMKIISIIALWASFGYSMAIYLAGLQGVPNDLYEASDLDGANAWQKFWKVTLPLIWPSVTICLYIAIRGTLGMSEYIIFLTNGTYGTTTIGFYIYKMTMNMANKGQVSALSLVFFVFVTTIMLLFDKFVRRHEEEV